MSGDANARYAGPAGGFVRRWKDPDYVDRYVRFTRGVVYDAEVWRRRLEIAPDATLLDLGCCEAKLLVALSPWIRRGVGVDASGAAIARARRNVEEAEATNIELIECDFRQLDLPDESVTAAVSMAALHHVPDDDKSEVLRRVHRCLRAGGLLYLDDDTFNFPPDEFESQVEPMYAEFERRFGSEGWATLQRELAGSDFECTSYLDDLVSGVRSVGFEIEDVVEHGLNGVTLRARRPR